MKILILEDEINAVKWLTRLVEELDPKNEIVAAIESVEDAISWLETHPGPELIISDIQLADGLSFEVFMNMKQQVPIIFTTAYDAYMLKAFKVNSIDYLLKPIDKEELRTAFKKYHSLHNKLPVINLNEKLLEIIQQSPNKEYKSRFLVRHADRLISIPVQEVAFLKAESKVVFIHTKDGEKYITDNTLDELEPMLDPAVFFRLNRQYISPIVSIEKIFNHFNGKLKISLVNSDDKEIFVSRERAGEFKKWLGR